MILEIDWPAVLQSFQKTNSKHRTKSPTGDFQTMP